MNNNKNAKSLSRGFCPNIILMLTLAVIVCGLGACSEQAVPESPAKPPLKHASDSKVIFLSTQFNPIEEASKIRSILAEGYPGEVDFQSNDNNLIFRKLRSTGNASEQVLVGALHGDLANLHKKGVLTSVDDVIAALPDHHYNKNYLQLASFGSNDHFYIPWMQATYIMAANRKALAYLPAGADINALTYEQLLKWAENMKSQTGQSRLAFPMGEKGLIHRFFQGYMYPAFTGGVVTQFASDDAKNMWQYFQKLWQVSSPHSLSYTTMSEPLLAEDIWVAWDHTARLIDAFESDSEKFVAFPAPSGPKGRSFMAVISGLAIPAEQKNTESAKALLEFMTHPDIELEVVKQTGFFPAEDDIDFSQLPPPLQKIASAVQQQASAPDALTTLLPAGLGEQGGVFNSLFTLTFSDIILGNQDIDKVLRHYAEEMNKLFQLTQAPCWQPDPISEKACAVY